MSACLCAKSLCCLTSFLPTGAPDLAGCKGGESCWNLESGSMWLSHSPPASFFYRKTKDTVKGRLHSECSFSPSLFSLSLSFQLKRTSWESQAPSPKGMSDLPRVGRPREPLAWLLTVPTSSGQEGALLFSSWGSSTGAPWSGRKQPQSHLTLCLSSLLIFCSVLGMPFREL